MPGPDRDDQESRDELEAGVYRLAAHMRALSGLFHGLVHDLKSPINSLVVNLELLKTTVSEEPDLERQQRYIGILDDELVRLNRSVERLLPAAGPPRDERQRFDLRELVDRVCELLVTTARHQSVELELDLPDEGRTVPVDGYPDRVKQAFLAVAVNALEAMPEGGRMSVSLREEDGRAVVRVTDSGPGVPEEVEGRLYEPHTSTKPGHPGIGLHAARSVVESTNGSIEHDAPPDGGSRFTLTLPLAH